ncbi:hypothetical protein ACFFQW_47585 [Umezawaea endophytica]|uniref:Effector-associated domain-containing protein n=1 Tax=Umezawaea endophytica TaxID=1654476 RepID=A0A9X3A4Y7_9PSEU|nr:hypothetical protein [Umezawaea endophytica]MCS7483284.1 hypothetical protein [Umezawaea endophytica]
MDIVNFTDPDRSAAHQRTVQTGLYALLERSFAEAGITWSSCHVEDRGDGALILVPPEFPKSDLADRWPTRLLAGLRLHNALHSHEARVHLRVALHAGEVHLNAHGAVSPAINLACRMVDAEEARRALADSGGILALIASDLFYGDVVKAEPAAMPNSYRRIPVVVKRTEAVIWLRLPDGGDGGVDATSAPARPPRGTRFVDLVDALSALGVMVDVAGRQVVLEQLRSEIGAAVRYHAQTRLHVVSILRTCQRYEGGLAELAGVLRDVEGDSLAMRHFDVVVRDWVADGAG